MHTTRRRHYPNLAALAAPWTKLEWWATCKKCGHESRVPETCLHGAIARLGGGVAAKDARPGLFCSRCGSRDFRTDVVPGHGCQAAIPGTGANAGPSSRAKLPPVRKPRLPTAECARAAR